MTIYRTVVADPAWGFEDKLPGESRGAEKNYTVMNVDDICDLELPPIADDAILFLWRVASQVEEACRVARAWGFVPKSEIVWRKQTSSGLVHFGMGHYVRMAHEVCMIASRGRGAAMILDHSIRSVFDYPVEIHSPERSVFDAPAGIHSEKPELFYDLVERLSPGPIVELFARKRRKGWTCLGDDLGTHMNVKTSKRKEVRFHVQCLLITEGVAFSDWDFVVDSMQEAEDLCKLHMAPSDQSLVIGRNFECNKTEKAYVNCTVALIRKGGKRTVVEELIHPLHTQLQARELSRKRETVDETRFNP